MSFASTFDEFLASRRPRRKSEKKISHWQQSSLREIKCLPTLCDILSRRGLNSPRVTGCVRLEMTGPPPSRTHYASMPECYVPYKLRNRRFFLISVSVAIVSSHFTYRRKDGLAELAWVSGHIGLIKYITRNGQTPVSACSNRVWLIIFSMKCTISWH